MKIAIDANEANIKNRVGSGQYTYQILKQWSRSGSPHDFHLFLKHKPLDSLPAPTTSWHYHHVLPKRLWLKFSLPLRLALSPRYDAFFSPAHYSPLTKAPLIVTIHDLAYEYFPELFLKSDLYKLKKWSRASVARATRIIAVSEATKQDIISIYGIPADKISVVHNGFDQTQFHPDIKPNRSALKKYKIPFSSYILFVGTIQPRKNARKLIQAFHLLKESGYKGNLVIAGAKGWMSDDTYATIRKSKYKKNIIKTGYIDDSDLPALYKYADVYALPSLYEGFGIPLIESMAVGTPVVASNNSSMPEVVGNAGLLFNSRDPADIANKISTVIKKRSHYARLGIKQSKKFSWEKTARETLKVITLAIDSQSRVK